MTFDELKAAHAAGMTIEVRVSWINGHPEWYPLDNSGFDGDASDYRIKPTEEKPE